MKARSDLDIFTTRAGGESGLAVGRGNVANTLPASARAIARAVAAELRGDVDAAPTLIARAAEGSGSALPGDLRSRFEQSLGADLGGVRVHTDGAAADAAASVGARAYATGQDVFMGAGQYRPDTSDGMFLIAHEVAHTVQQRGAASGPQYKLEVTSPGDACEVEADRAAAAMVSGAPASIGGAAPSLARQAIGSHDAAPSQPTAAPSPHEEHGPQSIEPWDGEVGHAESAPAAAAPAASTLRPIPSPAREQSVEADAQAVFAWINDKIHEASPTSGTYDFSVTPSAQRISQLLTSGNLTSAPVPINENLDVHNTVAPGQIIGTVQFMLRPRGTNQSSPRLEGAVVAVMRLRIFSRGEARNTELPGGQVEVGTMSLAQPPASSGQAPASSSPR